MKLPEAVKEIMESVSAVLCDRAEKYGDPRISFPRYAASVGESATAFDFAMIMARVKLQRESYAHQRDNLIDAIGYLVIGLILQGGSNGESEQGHVNRQADS